MDVSDFYVGSSALWKGVMARVEAVAPTPWPVLLLGPRGSGKSMLAREIHRRSGRSGALVLGPAPAIADSLLQAELFGHARGAFTDAREERAGLLELAHEGTLFFDEIEAASYALQSVLVGQVEQLEVRRIGDSRARRVDVRFIYATNADLSSLADRGRFRPDLLDRIGYLVVKVPALAQCPDLILPLATRFLQERMRVLRRTIEVEFSVPVKQRLLGHPWPGNIRQLRGVCTEIAIKLTLQRPVIPEDLPAEVTASSQPDPDRERRAILREQVTTTLRQTDGNKSEAARRFRGVRLGAQRTGRLPGLPAGRDHSEDPEARVGARDLVGRGSLCCAGSARNGANQRAVSRFLPAPGVRRGRARKGRGFRIRRLLGDTEE
jgi:DNA-binding NtrC family response regulator